jgi:hypothetical protein
VLAGWVQRRRLLSKKPILLSTDLNYDHSRLNFEVAFDESFWQTRVSRAYDRPKTYYYSMVCPRCSLLTLDY